MKRSVIDKLRVALMKFKKAPEKEEIFFVPCLHFSVIDLVVRVDWVVFIKIQWINGERILPV